MNTLVTGPVVSSEVKCRLARFEVRSKLVRFEVKAKWPRSEMV